jgi:hypothetical protein
VAMSPAPRTGASLHLPRTAEKPIAARGIVRSQGRPFRLPTSSGP